MLAWGTIDSQPAFLEERCPPLSSNKIDKGEGAG
jgi:hypothetical protein